MDPNDGGSDLMTEFEVTNEWNGRPITDHETKISMTFSEAKDGVKIELRAPFFNDPPPPETKPGQPCFKLWDHEVVEVFLLNSKNGNYLELEFGPHGQHLVLLLTTNKKCIKHSLPLEYSAEIDLENGTWRGKALVPLSYIPPGVDKFNIYGIHMDQAKPGDRVYESLFPVPGEQADFHRTQFFGTWNQSHFLFPKITELSDIWKCALNSPKP
ncbi:hypothetical protein TCAL_05125 [Tigriopus californicus]|uniref:Uncharacterized protein n=1 Tax=Tigriopus californicus TaxID=6832 RepID=A0A553PNE9_TIGCA|nr:UPF0462 protein C4orf33 homolog [Tigriopus californicus]TRY79197.1 hypothetical protein TCAL_05125 [Tigriopus californicus]|eukprot:TCALIF_05125-PA protein Name:"Similar to D3Ertd751e UPF0462 protein C4orf33 homolog (Mus musculus)" AED:0.09 eAED:0.09 QI:93/1/1/1/1/1/3/33/212